VGLLSFTAVSKVMGVLQCREGEFVAT